MIHPTQHEPATSEQIAEGQRCRHFMRMYGALREYGIDLFEPHGWVAGAVGSELLLLLHAHFEQKNSPRRCSYIQGVLTEYRQRWPYMQPNYNSN